MADMLPEGQSPMPGGHDDCVNSLEALRGENEALRRQAELLKQNFADLASRYDALLEERKELESTLEEKETRLAFYRSQELSREIDDLRAVSNELAVVSLSENALVQFRRLFLEKETELMQLKERIGRHLSRRNAGTS